MQLIQIGVQEAPKALSILEMFQQMAAREAEMIREARERALERESAAAIARMRSRCSS